MTKITKKITYTKKDSKKTLKNNKNLKKKKKNVKKNKKLEIYQKQYEDKNNLLDKKEMSVEEIKLRETLSELNNEYREKIYKLKEKEEIYPLLEKIESVRIKLVKYHQMKYPSIYDPKMIDKINNKKEFSIYKINKQDKEINQLYEESEKNSEINSKINSETNSEKSNNDTIFKISNTQNFIRNYMSPYTNNNNLLIVHGTGVGKTCTAITIAEQFKNIISNNNKKITIINGKDFTRQLFNVEKVRIGNPENQCTGDEYIDSLGSIGPELVEKCQENKDECLNLQNKVKKIQEKFYSSFNMFEWANKINNIITKKGKNVSVEEALNHKIKKIDNMFSDAMIIIDEAHSLNSEKSDLRLVTRILSDVLFYSNNLRLIMLTATPMYDKASDIISLINYMLINDKRVPIEISDIFDEFKKLKPGAENILKEKTRGYISYLRGDNPINFPVRLPISINLPSNQLVNLNKYPTIPDNFKSTLHKMQFLELINCPMKKYQEEIYQKLNELSGESNYISKWTNVSNCVYQSLKNAKGIPESTYESIGLNAISTNIKGKVTRRFIDDEIGKQFINPNLANYSSKISKIIENIIKSTKNGPVFIYTNFLDSGVVPLIIALEMIGFRPYKAHSNPYIDNKYKSSEYLGDYILKTGQPDKFTIKSKDVKNYINMGPSMINEKNVKIFIGTQASSEGINLFGYREVHILEPHWNLSRLEQSIGRTIRNESHLHLPVMYRNVSVYLYAATLENDAIETIDLYKYRVSEDKAITSGIIEKAIIKENAIDCSLNIEGNKYDETKFPKEINMISSVGKKVKVELSDQPYSRMCHYMFDCNYKCSASNIPSEKDNSSYQLEHVKMEVYRVLLEIRNLVAKNFRVNIDDIGSILNINDDNIIAIAIFKLLDNKKIIKDKNGNKGYIDKLDNTLLFIPEWEKSKNIEYATQYMKFDEIQHQYKYINLKYYIDYLNKLLSNTTSKTSISYHDVISQIKWKVDSIKYQKKNDKFNLKLTDQEIVEYVYNNLIFIIKLELLKYIVYKMIISGLDGLDDIEVMITNSIKHHLVYYSDLTIGGPNELKNKLYGFIIANTNNIVLYSMDKTNNNLEIDSGSLKKLVENKSKIIKNIKLSSLYGFSRLEKENLPPVFKVVDTTKDVKKSIKGITCGTIVRENITKYLKKLKVFETKGNRGVICNDLELTFKRLDNLKEDGNRWFLYPEEYLLSQ